MLVKVTTHIWIGRPKLSRAFWFCVLCVYTAALLAVIAAFPPSVDGILQTDADQIELALKIYYIRLAAMCTGLTLIPFLLWKSLKYASSFMKLFATAGLLMYIDEYLVLQDIMHCPKTLAVQLALLLRPAAIMAMAWMTFELNFRVENGP